MGNFDHQAKPAGLGQSTRETVVRDGLENGLSTLEPMHDRQDLFDGRSRRPLLKSRGAQFLQEPATKDRRRRIDW